MPGHSYTAAACFLSPQNCRKREPFLHSQLLPPPRNATVNGSSMAFYIGGEKTTLFLYLSSSLDCLMFFISSRGRLIEISVSCSTDWFKSAMSIHSCWLMVKASYWGASVNRWLFSYLDQEPFLTIFKYAFQYTSPFLLIQPHLNKLFTSALSLPFLLSWLLNLCLGNIAVW